MNILTTHSQSANYATKIYKNLSPENTSVKFYNIFLLYSHYSTLEEKMLL